MRGRPIGVPVKVDHRRFTIICLNDPGNHKPNYFVMIGHSFGLVSAVYNYNRRSAAINDIFEEIFSMISFNFCDDKYGFETCAMAPGKESGRRSSLPAWSSVR